MKKIMLLWMLILVPLVTGIEFCGDEVLPNTDCQLITPELACSTNMEIYNESLDSYKSVAISAIDNYLIYNYTFNEPAGSYLFILCDNSTRQIVVRDTLDSKTDTIIVNQGTINTTVNTIDTNVDTVLVNQGTINSTVNDIESKVDIIDTNLDSVNATLYDVDQNVKTIIFNLFDRILDFIWSDYTPRVVTDSTGADLNKTVITDCVWNEDGSGCDNYKEIDNIR